MSTIRTIKIFAKEVRKDKQSFIACTTQIKDKWYKIKFTRECNSIPNSRGVYELKIDVADTSYQKGETYINKQGKKAQGNDIIWVRKIAEIRQYTEEELRENNAIVMGAIFDGEELPF